MGEKFSWSKFFGGLNTVVGWAKFASFWLKLAMILIPIILSAWAYKSVYSKGYSKGVAVTTEIKDREFKQWIADHPQQTISGSTVNNNVNKPNNRFRMSVFPLTVGWCE